MYQGLDEKGPCYVDGGIYANNPAMCAVAQVINERHPGGHLWVQGQGGLDRVQACPKLIQSIKDHKNEGASPRGEFLDDIYLLSVGNGFTPKHLSPITRNGMADWGYCQWMLSPSNPLVLLQLALESGIIATHYQTQQMLGTHYNRLNPTVEHAFTLTRADMMESVLAQVLCRDDTKEQLNKTIDWFTHGAGKAWFEAD